MTANTATQADPGVSAASRRELVLTCDETGTVVMLTASDSARPKWVRAVAFFASGETFWYELPVGEHKYGKYGFDLVHSNPFGEQTIRFTCRGGLVPGPTELSEADVATEGSRVPMVLHLTMTPQIAPVLPDDPYGNQALPAQAFTTTGTLAMGSVVHYLRGTTWSAARKVGNEPQNGARVQGSFQDGSGVLATLAPGEPTKDRAAAFHSNNRATTQAVKYWEIDGPERSVASRMQCIIGEHSTVSIVGTPRHVENYQHVAFLQASERAGTWTRTSYTPFDFRRGGMTGFGLVEQVSQVTSLYPAPVVSAELPDPWD